MRVHSNSCLVAVALAVSCLLLVPQPAQAYAGPGAGMELFSYFAGLVAIIAVALGLVLLWPLWALLSYLRRAWRKPVKEPEDEEAAVNAPEPAEEVGHDKP